MDKTVVYLEITDVNQFIAELQLRRIKTVREACWHRVTQMIETLKRRFTAWDPSDATILRLDVVYWRKMYMPEDEETKREKEEAYMKIVQPVVEKIEQAASVENGEYHLGKAEW